MDIGVNLIDSYLRLAGYLTFSEFEVQGRDADGHYQALTDVDIVGLRLPGDVFVGDPHDDEESQLLLIDDPALQLEEDCVDLIIGEVKQGEATINPGLYDHRVLHAVLQRMEWLFDESLGVVVEGLQGDGIHHSPARGGGTIRSRIVAFGRAPRTSLNVISHTHVVETMLGFFEQFEEAIRPIQYRDPAPALLRFLTKTGFEVTKPQEE